jgi:hypothetical protein
MTTNYCLRFETPLTWRGQVPVFISTRNRVAPLYPQALGSLLSPPTTRRATMEVFDRTSTRVSTQLSLTVLLITSLHGPRRIHRFPLLYPIVALETYLFAKPLLSYGCLCWLHSSYLEQISHSILLQVTYLPYQIRGSSDVLELILCTMKTYGGVEI